MGPLNVAAFAHRWLILVTLVCGAQSRPPDDFQISVHVDLVQLDATVRDTRGRGASDLAERNFEVYEDGVRQTIRLFRHEDLPVTVGIVVDHSGSMRRKLPYVTAAARAFVQSSSPEDEIFVVNFNESVTMGLPDVLPFSNRPDDLARAVANAPITGETALYDAILVAQERLRSGSRGKKALVVISDGGDNRSAHSLPEVLQDAGQSHAVLYTIGIFDDEDPDQNPRVLKHLAEATGGEVFFPRELKDVALDCERIARDIRHQYVLGYVSTNPAERGGYRTVRVAARAPGMGRLVVRTRAGYIPGEAGK